MRSSARRSSSTARRETTMLPRRRSIFRIWNGCGWFISGPTSRIGRTSTWLTGQERHGAVEIDGEAALDAAEDHAGDAGLFVEGALELDPAFLAAGLVARQHGFAQRVLDPLEIDLDLVADLRSSAGTPGMENSLSEMRPSVFRPTSTMAKSFSMATMVPVMTVPSWRRLGHEALLRAWPRNRRGWGWRWIACS